MHQTFGHRFIFAPLVMMARLLTKAIILRVMWILMEKDKLTVGLCNRTDRITFGKEFHLEQHPDQSNHYQLGLFYNTHSVVNAVFMFPNCLP